MKLAEIDKLIRVLVVPAVADKRQDSMEEVEEDELVSKEMINIQVIIVIVCVYNIQFDYYSQGRADE